MNIQNKLDEFIANANCGIEVANFFVDIESDLARGVIKKSDIQISVRQFQKILTLSKSAYMGLSIVLELGPDCVSISKSQRQKIMKSPHQYARIILIKDFDLSESEALQMIKNQKEIFKNEDGYVERTVMRHCSKKFSDKTIREMQLKGNIFDCCQLWINGVGNPPMVWILQTDGYSILDNKLNSLKYNEFVTNTKNRDAFDAWKAEYAAKCESEDLRKEFVGYKLKDTPKKSSQTNRVAL